MKEKKYIKVSLLILLIIIILTVIFLYTKKNENNHNSNIVENDISYIEMTEENYKKYNNDEYLFKIFNIKRNNNKTITIQGRVYKVRELPTLTEEQYNDLANGETVKIMEFEMKLTSDENLIDEDGTYAGHDLYIVSENNISFYVSKNDDGTGTLYDAAEIALCDGTDIYMQITLDNNTPTESGLGNMPLSKYLNNKIGYTKLDDTVVLDTYNTEFTFKNGKCTSIFFPSV